MASIVRSGSTVFHLSSSAPPRLCASQGPVWRFNPRRFQVCSLLPQFFSPVRPRSQPTVASIVRSGSTVFHLSSSAPPRLCASQGTVWCFNPRRFQVCSLLPQVSAPSASEPAHRGLDRQIGEHRISSIQLSATAPLREPRPCMAL